MINELQLNRHLNRIQLIRHGAMTPRMNATGKIAALIAYMN